MTKKYLLIGGIIVLIGAVGFFAFSNKGAETGTAALRNDILTESECKINEMVFYYSNQCGWCQKVKEEGTIDKIRELGVIVKEVNVRTGEIKHEFSGVPTFVINEKIYSGYKTFEELQELFGCEEKEVQPIIAETEFNGEHGEKVFLADGEIKIDVSELDDNLTHYYHVELPTEKTVYFFIVKDKNGVYNAAANACQVCFQDRMGFYRDGDFMVCEACQNKYPVEKIATEKGGCNPGPIVSDLEVSNGQTIIQQSAIEEIADLF